MHKPWHRSIRWPQAAFTCGETQKGTSVSPEELRPSLQRTQPLNWDLRWAEDISDKENSVRDYKKLILTGEKKNQWSKESGKVTGERKEMNHEGSGILFEVVWTRPIENRKRGWLHGHVTCAFPRDSKLRWTLSLFTALLLACLTFVVTSSLNLFCKWRPMGQWSRHMSRGDTCGRHVCMSLLLHAPLVFTKPHEHRLPVPLLCMGAQQLKASTIEFFFT